MAIQVIAEIWSHSKARGSRLLVLLALGDRARKEDGVCWPGVATIAQQARVTERDVQYHLAQLIDEGEVKVVRRGGSGPRDTTIYQVTVGAYKGAKIFTLSKTPGSGEFAAPERKLEGADPVDNPVDNDVDNPDKGAKTPPKRVQPASPDPLDPSEPSEAVSTGLSTTQAPDPSEPETETDPATGRQRIVKRARAL